MITQNPDSSRIFLLTVSATRMCSWSKCGISGPFWFTWDQMPTLDQPWMEVWGQFQNTDGDPMGNPHLPHRLSEQREQILFPHYWGSISSNCLGRGVDSWGHIWTVTRAGRHICLPRKVMTQVPAFAILGLHSVSSRFSYSPDIL